MHLDKIHKNWRSFFEQESQKSYFIDLMKKINEEESKYTVYPDSHLRLRAFEETDPMNIRAIIMGQDCYFSAKSPIPEAVGLSFSVPKALTKIPPSLKNIFTELEQDIDEFRRPDHGSLEQWTDNVLLLNTVLSVRAGLAASHAKKFGWETLTKAALKHLSDINTGFVYLGWGKFAHAQAGVIDEKKHLIIKTSHPSPLSNYKSGQDFTAFTGSKCFSMANKWLTEKYGKGIDWRIA